LQRKRAREGEKERRSERKRERERDEVGISEALGYCVNGGSESVTSKLKSDAFSLSLSLSHFSFSPAYIAIGKVSLQYEGRRLLRWQMSGCKRAVGNHPKGVKVTHSKGSKIGENICRRKRFVSTFSAKSVSQVLARTPRCVEGSLLVNHQERTFFLEEMTWKSILQRRPLL